MPRDELVSRAPEDLRPADREALAASGIEPEEARRQLEILRHPPAPVRLIRPCTPGDGIRNEERGRKQREQIRLRGEPNVLHPGGQV